ncbi:MULTISPECIES: alpha/beta hydrolase [unclassified Leucobacter]|uniref:alpha/beta hydrolase n=1 Tax=unclassified Leucobacter TaxID=2621730 RepID=UPI00165EA6A5|nr:MULTISPECIES: alpha/beta hydrolase-fold protein [unclassified Leucobacter]MBC9927675.1 hypothetical protein [Leucobacter sp. cx-169]
MHALALDPQVIRWTIGGVPADEASAVAALAERPLLILMHGLGSHEGDLIGLVPLLPQGFVCASLRAPFAVAAPLTGGYTWFPESLQSADAAPESRAENAAWLAAQAVLEWLDDVEARVPGAQVTSAVMGFSQGGVMATSMLRARPQRFAAAVNCSGFTAPGVFPGDAELEALRPPLFWGRDVADPVIGAEAIARTATWLPTHSTLEAREYPGVGHSVSRDELDDVFVFLSQNVPGALPIR